jgi:hypothetical protein
MSMLVVSPPGGEPGELGLSLYSAAIEYWGLWVRGIFVHPITVTEMTVSAAFIIIIFVAAFLLPKKIRKWSIIAASSITAVLLSFFVIRPYWIDHQVSKKTEQLNRFLEGEYPNQAWKISRQTGRQYSPYQLSVEFENEKGWIYTYSVVDEKNICQSVWTPPEGSFPNEGKHFERNKCD